MIWKILKAVVIGIVEGITEWLPVSSTGHMILLNELIHLDVSDEFYEMLLVVIQLGAILAVPILFWDRLWPFSKGKSLEQMRKTLGLWGRVALGALPCAVLGLLLDDLIDRYLFGYLTVAIMLIVYGVAFIFVEKIRAENIFRIESVYDIDYSDALRIGAFQALSLIPGTSRSGATILGGMLTGVSREAGAEFSFFMAIPIMLGASGLKILKFTLGGFIPNGDELMLLFVGILVSFAVSLFAIRFLMDFVKHHDFKIFGYYRIALGLIVIIYFLVKSFV